MDGFLSSYFIFLLAAALKLNSITMIANNAFKKTGRHLEADNARPLPFSPSIKDEHASLNHTDAAHLEHPLETIRQMYYKPSSDSRMDGDLGDFRKQTTETFFGTTYPPPRDFDNPRIYQLFHHSDAQHVVGWVQIAPNGTKQVKLLAPLSVARKPALDRLCFSRELQDSPIKFSPLLSNHAASDANLFISTFSEDFIIYQGCLQRPKKDVVSVNECTSINGIQSSNNASSVACCDAIMSVMTDDEIKDFKLRNKKQQPFCNKNRGKIVLMCKFNCLKMVQFPPPAQYDLGPDVGAPKILSPNKDTPSSTPPDSKSFRSDDTNNKKFSDEGFEDTLATKFFERINNAVTSSKTTENPEEPCPSTSSQAYGTQEPRPSTSAQAFSEQAHVND